MEARYDQAQDITLVLRREEIERLSVGPTHDFWSMFISSSEINPQTRRPYRLLTGVNEVLGARFFLGYTHNEDGIFRDSLEVDNGYGKIRIPTQARDPWLINLSDEGTSFVRTGWPHGIRYDGQSKLFILNGDI